MKKFLIMTVLCLIGVFDFSGCGLGGDGLGTFNGISFDRPPRKLKPGQGYFEIWLGFNKPSGGKDWVSILKFDRVTGTDHPILNDVPSTLTLPTDRDIDSAVSAAISIELENDPDPATPNRIFMSGDFIETVATMELRGSDALNMDLSDSNIITGKFVMGTPSVGYNDSASGVWFVNAPFGQAQGAGLKLPVLPAGFQYEAWVATQSETVQLSTGKFYSASLPDNDGGGPNAGGGSVPAFPGQDFFVNNYNEQLQGYIKLLPSNVDSTTYKSIFYFPIRIRNRIPSNPLKPSDQPAEDFWDVVVSVEPDPDNDPLQPFAIFPLVNFGQQIIPKPANTVIQMDNFAGGVAQLVKVDLSKLK